MAATALRILGIVIGVLVALAAIAVALVVFVLDWNWLRGPLGERATAALGRGVAIQGPLRVQWGRITSIHAEAVRVGNPRWARQPDMARFD
ncbi:MAG TPA: AsmA family protein, partial [Magnetospirillum sp.]|nr:AsmA family protein [Magnetospirillum sp.]